MPLRRSDMAHHGQQGQVLVAGMLLAALLSLAWVRYFETGEVVDAASRLTHGLDSAAYSGALVQARTLNLLAYVNRAHTAHQLAMAHLVTLASWAHFGAMQARQLTQGNPPAHLIGMAFGAAHGKAYLAAAQATGLHSQARTGGALGIAHAAHERFVHEHLLALTQALADGLPAARLAAMRAVLRAHYPEYGASLQDPVVADDAWPSALRWRIPGASEREALRALAARFPFLGPRDGTARAPWSVDSRCPVLRHELRRRGATVLDDSGRWRALDTQSFHAVRSNRWVGCYYREYAMGWAWLPSQAGARIDATYSESAPEDFSQQDFWRWVRSATQWDLVAGADNPMANSYAVRDAPMWPSRGLARYLEASPSSTPEGEFGFTVRLQVPSRGTGPTLHARSAAEVYFLRPHGRADGVLEQPNLFHPFWHARLSDRLSRSPGER